MGQSYRDLRAWQGAMKLVPQVYRVCRRFPREEVFGLGSQLRRACISIASNIAEGQARHSPREFIRFLRNSRGSLAEVETQLLAAVALDYVKQSEIDDLLHDLDQLNRMIAGLIHSQEPTSV